MDMVFDGPGAKLPTATLRRSAMQPRRRLIAGDLDRWLASRWEWVRPRALPLLAAFVGLVVTLGAVKYVMVYAYSENLALHMHARALEIRPSGAALQCEPPTAHTAGAVQILLEPIAPGEPYIELTFTTSDAP
jgi:hypothetical protein